MNRTKNETPSLPLLFNGTSALNEKLLQFIWQFGYFNKTGLFTAEGEALSILFPGSLNKNGGPDFTAAKIKIGNTLLAGNVELHLKTSDWRKHRHEGDAAYKNVILHVVFGHDEAVNDVPVLALSSRISTLLLTTYESFMNNAAYVPCAGSITHVKELSWKGWKERLVVERLTRKSDRVLQLFESANHHWEETLWWLLARSFGGTVNADAFESMARSIPVNLLSKHKTSVVQLEALLLGQASLLNDEFEEDYPKLLQREYRFLKTKYGLQASPLPAQFLRMRPVAFPTLRLSQLAGLVQQSSALFSALTDAQELGEVKALFAVTANDYWHYHYTFKQSSSYKPKTLGADAVNTILINTVVPLVFAYGRYRNSEALRDKAVRWLEEISAETNAVIKGFASLGVYSRSAFDSQALIELKNVYCSEKRCLDCAVGNQLLREAAAVYAHPK